MSSAQGWKMMNGENAEQKSAGVAAAKIGAVWKKAFNPRETGVYYALILLVCALAVVTNALGQENYLSMINVMNVLYQSSLSALMAVSMTVILISGNFDLSVAAVAALAGTILVSLADSMGFLPAVGIAVLVSVLVGVLNGSIVLGLGVNAFIVTLGTLTAIRGVVLIYTGGQSLAANTSHAISDMKMLESGSWALGPELLALGVILAAASAVVIWQRYRRSRVVFPGPVVAFVVAVGIIVLDVGRSLTINVPKPVVYMAAFCFIVWGVLRFTMIGRRLYAVGGNAEAARLSGISVFKYRMICFVLSSATAGFAGILFASRMRSIDPTAMQGNELTVIAAAILGGTSLFGGSGSVVRSVAGALLLYSLDNGFNVLNLGANYQGLVEGTVVVGAAAIYSIGKAKA